MNTDWFAAEIKYWNGNVVWKPALQLSDGVASDVAYLEFECATKEDCDAFIRENILGKGEVTN